MTEPHAAKSSLAEHPAIADAHAESAGCFWVFGYGSLMWNPGFPYEESVHALLPGFHRRFCVRSTIYRGTPERPGLVLGIDSGGECSGMAFRVAAERREDVLAYLFEREMRSYVYTPSWVSVTIAGSATRALTFVVRRDHQQFVCMSDDDMVSIIASSAGANGSNFDYLQNTVRALHALGVPDPALDSLYAAVSARVATSDPDAASRRSPAPARSP
jgi:cation transport protein ChaC